MKNWNELSITDKNDIIKVAVQNGITTLPEIRERYNEFAEGGPTISDEEYQDRMRQVAQENWRNWGYRNEEEAYQDQINNPTYDYRSFYANNPGAVNNAETHWPDTYKGALHRTFSDESVYSGKVNPVFNPSGIKGGRWTDKGYVPHGEQFAVPFNMLGDGGPEETIEKVLPEVVVKPSEKDKKSLSKMIRMLPDAKSREDMYYEIDPWDVDEPLKISQNESIDRLYNVYKLSGYPDVSSRRTISNYLEYPFSKWLDRPMYNPITNTMHLPNSEEAKYDAAGFIPELAHAYQFHGDKTGFLDFLKSAFHLPGDIKINGKSGYERPGHMEHTAHSIIEPAIYDYIQGYTDSFNPLSYASGGKIHIKEKNRGKFTALKERTGHSASWFKAHGTPAQRKMATFELNARKWKHGDGGNLFDEGGETNEEYYPIWLDGVTVKPSGNRSTTRDDWNWANWRELQNEREQQAAESIRRGIDRNGTPIAAGIYGLMAAPFAIEGLGSSAVANGIRTGLQAMNTAFTPSTWLNPVTGAKLLSPTVGTIADAGIQGAFTYEGMNGLYNQGREGTLLSDPASTFMHGLEVLPLARPLGYAAKSTIGNRVKPFVDFLWNDGNVIQRRMPYNSNNFYREVSKEAIDDAISSGVVRTNGRFLGPYFAKGNSPLGTEDFIIEGYPNANEWVDTDYYHRFVRGYDFPKGRNLFLEEDAPFNTYAFPYYKSDVNTTPVSNFTYWQKHPLIGWRQHTFDNVTKAKHTYNAPKADIMPVEGSITTSDIPNITPENAASITPEQWTAAQNAAIARGDIVEAQRLRNMHFAMKAPNTTVSAPVYHGSDETFNVFDINRFGKNDAGSMGKGFYFTPDERFAANYGPTRSFYLNVENPIPETEQLNAFILGSRNKQEVLDRMDAMVQNGLADKAQIEALKPMVTDDLVTKVNMHDGVIPMDFQGRYAEIVAKNPSQIKSASAITYDDAGNVIPLSKRDDFSNSDIRYSLLPWIFGGGAGIAGYGYLNQDEGPLIGMAMGGRLRR